MKKTILLFTFWVLGFSNGFTDIGPANRLTADVVPSISFDSTISKFNYEYSVTNNQSSEQGMDSFDLVICDKRTKAGGTLENITIPDGKRWRGIFSSTEEVGNTVLWYPNTRPNPQDILSPPNDLILPGETFSGFGFLSKGLPSIKPFYVQGFVRPPTEKEVIDYFSKLLGQTFTNMDEIPREEYRKVFRPPHEDSFKGQTLSPEVLPDSQLQPIPLVQRMISLKDQAASLGWIKDNKGYRCEEGKNEYGIVESLNMKLKHALERLQKGKKKEAANILCAFISELNALYRTCEKDGRRFDDRGHCRGRKHKPMITDNAYFLLKANAEFVLSKLPRVKGCGGRDWNGHDRGFPGYEKGEGRD